MNQDVINHFREKSFTCALTLLYTSQWVIGSISGQNSPKFDPKCSTSAEDNTEDWNGNVQQYEEVQRGGITWVGKKSLVFVQQWRFSANKICK